MNPLRDLAESALRENMVDTSHGRLLVAGANQFKTLWTRDFCLSVPGLLIIGEKSLVERQLDLYFNFVREDGVAPRGVDVMPPQARVVLNCFGMGAWARSYEGRVLRPEYYGEHGTVAFDSGVLLIRAAIQAGCLDRYSSQISRILSFYQRSLREGLIVQAPFSDWQDSAKREGHGLYLHTLMAIVAPYVRHDLFIGLTERIREHFFDGIFYRQSRGGQIPLEANLWIIEHGLFKEDSKALYQRLKESDLWKKPGLPIYPQYPNREVAWTTKMVGLRHYHDGFRWSWLLAESARIAKLMNDQAEYDRIIKELQKWCEKQVFEIYDDFGRPAKRFLYFSEGPFSWGAAKIVEALGK